METKTYLVNTNFDVIKKELIQIDGNSITIQFKIMDKYTIVQIVGTKKGHTYEEFKHEITINVDLLV